MSSSLKDRLKHNKERSGGKAFKTEETQYTEAWGCSYQAGLNRGSRITMTCGVLVFLVGVVVLGFAEIKPYTTVEEVREIKV